MPVIAVAIYSSGEQTTERLHFREQFHVLPVSHACLLVAAYFLRGHLSEMGCLFRCCSALSFCFLSFLWNLLQLIGLGASHRPLFRSRKHVLHVKSFSTQDFWKKNLRFSNRLVTLAHLVAGDNRRWACLVIQFLGLAMSCNVLQIQSAEIWGLSYIICIIVMLMSMPWPRERLGRLHSPWACCEAEPLFSRFVLQTQAWYISCFAVRISRCTAGCLTFAFCDFSLYHRTY